MSDYQKIYEKINIFNKDIINNNFIVNIFDEKLKKNIQLVNQNKDKWTEKEKKELIHDFIIIFNRVAEKEINTVLFSPYRQTKLLNMKQLKFLEVEELLKYYEFCFSFDPKINIWNEQTFYLIDLLPLGHEFLQKKNSQVLNQSLYKKKANTYLLKSLLNKEYMVLNNTNYEEDFEFFYNKLISYNQKNDWNDILNKNPSFILAQIAQKQNYQPNNNQIFSIYHQLKKIYENNPTRKEERERIVDLFFDFLCNTLLFKNTLSPTKNIKKQIIQFFQIKNNFGFFDEAIIENKKLDVIKLKTNIEKKIEENKKTPSFSVIKKRNKI